MMRQGWATSVFQAAQHGSRMSGSDGKIRLPSRVSPLNRQRFSSGEIALLSVQARTGTESLAVDGANRRRAWAGSRDPLAARLAHQKPTEAAPEQPSHPPRASNPGTGSQPAPSRYSLVNEARYKVRLAVTNRAAAAPEAHRAGVDLARPSAMVRGDLRSCPLRRERAPCRVPRPLADAGGPQSGSARGRMANATGRSHRRRADR